MVVSGRKGSSLSAYLGCHEVCIISGNKEMETEEHIFHGRGIISTTISPCRSCVGTARWPGEKRVSQTTVSCSLHSK